MPKAELINAAEFARRQKISAEMVRKAKAQGVFEGALVKVPGKKKPLIKYKLGVRFYNARLDPTFRKVNQTPQGKGKPKGKAPGNGDPKGRGGGKTFVGARAKVEKYKAADLKLKHEIHKGLWLKKSDVADKAFKAARLMRDTFQNIPSRVSALVAAESNQAQCYRIINDELKEALNEFVRQLKGLAKGV
jgi:hypothetical protein